MFFFFFLFCGFCLEVPRAPAPRGGDLSVSPSPCSPVGQCEGDGAGSPLAGRTARYFAGAAGRRSRGSDQ